MDTLEDSVEKMIGIVEVWLEGQYEQTQEIEKHPQSFGDDAWKDLRKLFKEGLQ